MDRQKALELVEFKLDDSLSDHNIRPIPENATLLGWYDPRKNSENLAESFTFVAVFGYGGWTVDLTEALEIAEDYLHEQGWFQQRCMNPCGPHIVLEA